MKVRFIQPQIPTKDLVAYYKLWLSPVTTLKVFDYAFSDAGGTVASDVVPKYPGFEFGGDTSSLINVGNHGGSVQAVLMWVKATSLGSPIFPLDLNNTDYITVATNGTVSVVGFSGTSIFVDGVSGADTITLNTWHFVGIVDEEAFTASDLTIGAVVAQDGWAGLIGEVMLYDRELTPVDVKNIYEITRWRYGV